MINVVSVVGKQLHVYGSEEVDCSDILEEVKHLYSKEIKEFVKAKQPTCRMYEGKEEQLPGDVVAEWGLGSLCLTELGFTFEFKFIGPYFTLVVR